jgi:hypothetical protein
MFRIIYCKGIYIYILIPLQFRFLALKLWAGTHQPDSMHVDKEARTNRIRMHVHSVLAMIMTY